MNKKYQIFISSTYVDLKKEREKVKDAILTLYHFPVGMEQFGAANEDQWQIIKETIDTSDYYVLIIGQRYGSVIKKGPDAGISYTEKEYRYAREQGIPILAFIMDENVPVKAEYVEREHSEEFKQFKENVMNHHLVTWWTNADDLANKVTAALVKQFARLDRPGWIRTDCAEVNLINSPKNNERKPALKISLVPDICDDPDDEEKQLFSRSSNIENKDTSIIHLKTECAVDVSSIDKKYRELTIEDVSSEDRRYLTDDDIANYNRALPSKKMIDEYKKKSEKYLQIKNNGIAAAICIENIGTAKATEIKAEVIFPPEILVVSTDKAAHLEKPKAIKIPVDLHKIAMKRSDCNVSIQSIFAAYGHTELNDKLIEAFENSQNLSVPWYTNYYTDDDLYINDNVIQIDCEKGIIHKQKKLFNGVYLVPLKAGKFRIKIRSMCLEYEEPIETELICICD